jgi:hypothetical protein
VLNKEENQAVVERSRRYVLTDYLLSMSDGGVGKWVFMFYAFSMEFLVGRLRTLGWTLSCTAWGWLGLTLEVTEREE